MASQFHRTVQPGEPYSNYLGISVVWCPGIAAGVSEHVWRPIFGLKNAPFLLILRYFFCPYHQYELQKDALSQQKIDTFYLQTRPPNML